MNFYKTILFTFLIALCGFGELMAQTEKGGFMLGGNADFSRRNIQDINPTDPSGGDIISTSFNFRPSVSYFVIDNLAIGLATGIGRSSTKYGEQGNRDRVNRFSVGPMARYFFPIGKWAVFPQVQYLNSFDFGKNQFIALPNNRLYSYRYRFNSRDFQLAIGTTYFVTPRVGIEAVLSHSFITNRQSFREDDDSPLNLPEEMRHRVNSLNLNVGVQFYLHRKASSD
jgi:outer membrane protein W